MSSLRSAAWLSVVGTLLFIASEALAQVEIERPTAGKLNAVGLPAFVGPNLTQGIYFYGVTADYDRLLTSKWEVALSVDAGWTPSEQGKIERGLSATVISGFAFTERWSAEISYSKEFRRYGPDTHYNWSWANGDNAVGIGVSRMLWEKGRRSLDLSVGLERNLNGFGDLDRFGIGIRIQRLNARFGRKRKSRIL